MKSFNIWTYTKDCPQAHAAENAINNCGRNSANLESLLQLFNNDQTALTRFFVACLLYWSETEHYDDRNRSAILLAREITAHFKSLGSMQIPEKEMKEAYGFTHFAHRYLQSVMFNIIILHLKNSGYKDIYKWYDEQAFVIDRNLEKAIPYKDWRANAYC